MRHLRPALAVAAITITIAGCGTSSSGGPESAPASAAGSPATGVSAGPSSTSGSSDGAAPITATVVPAVDVVDVTSGQTVALRAAVATDKPTLLWMWAPH